MTAPSRGAVLAVLVVGGVLGCLARLGVTTALPTPPGGWPTGTFLVNLLGCLALGYLLERLAHLTAAGGTAHRTALLRVGLGTGVIGTFTTYSGLAVEIDLLVRDRAVGLALGYAAASIGAGLLCTATGVLLATARNRRGATP